MKQLSRTAYVKDDGATVAVLNPDTGLLELMNFGWAAQALIRELGHDAFRKDLVFEEAITGTATCPVPRLCLEHAWVDSDGDLVTFFSSTKFRLCRPCPQLVRALGTRAFIADEHLLESCRIIVSEDYND